MNVGPDLNGCVKVNKWNVTTLSDFALSPLCRVPRTQKQNEKLQWSFSNHKENTHAHTHWHTGFKVDIFDSWTRSAVMEQHSFWVVIDAPLKLSAILGCNLSFLRLSCVSAGVGHVGGSQVFCLCSMEAARAFLCVKCCIFTCRAQTGVSCVFRVLS